MKLFVFTFEFNGSHLTSNYHDGGSALVSAETKEEAMAKLVEYNKKLFKNDEEYALNWDKLDSVKEVGIANEEVLMIFQDTGCC